MKYKYWNILIYERLNFNFIQEVSNWFKIMKFEKDFVIKSKRAVVYNLGRSYNNWNVMFAGTMISL